MATQFENASDSANHFGTQRRESDLNTRVFADAAVPAQSLDQAKETPPTVRRRVELRSLAALGFKPSAVAYPHVSPSLSELAPTSLPRVSHRDIGRRALLSVRTSLPRRMRSSASSHGTDRWRLPRSVKVRTVLGDADFYASNRVDRRCRTDRDVSERFLLASGTDIRCHDAATRIRTRRPNADGHGVAGRWVPQYPVAAH